VKGLLPIEKQVPVPYDVRLGKARAKALACLESFPEFADICEALRGPDAPYVGRPTIPVTH
jgi:hypothetical protein